MRIPKTITFPFGYKIGVRMVTREEMRGVLSLTMEQKVDDGCWDREKQLIYIVTDDLTLPQKRYVLAHELGHAWNDWMDTFLDTWTISDRGVVNPSPHEH